MKQSEKRWSGVSLLILLAVASTSLRLAAGDATLTLSNVPVATAAPSTPVATAAPATPKATAAPSTPAATAAPATPAATKAASATPTATPASTPAATPAAKATPAATPAATKAPATTPTATKAPTTTPAAKKTPTATPTATTAASAAAALLAQANSLDATPVTTATPAATKAPSTPIATKAPVASPPPISSPPPPASPPPPPPVDPRATSLSATLRITGPGVWPFSTQEASSVVTSLSQTLTTVTISSINIINATQPSTRRRSLLHRMLLATNDTADVQLELAGTTSAAALSINSDLANNVANGNLQNALIRNNLPTEQLSLTSSSAAIPTVNATCNTGSFEGACITAGGSGLSLGAIIAIAASAGAVALAVIAGGVGCVLRRQKQRRRERESQTPATRKGLTPTEARPFFEDKSKLQKGVSMTATSGNVAVIPVSGEGGAPDAVALDHGIDGETYAEMLEMGGREARDRLHIKLPAFGGKPKTASGIPGISRSSSTVSHQNSMQLSRAVSRAQSQGVMERLAEEGEPSRNAKRRKDGQQP